MSGPCDMSSINGTCGAPRSVKLVILAPAAQYMATVGRHQILAVQVIVLQVPVKPGTCLVRTELAAQVHQVIILVQEQRLGSVIVFMAIVAMVRAIVDRGIAIQGTAVDFH